MGTDQAFVQEWFKAHACQLADKGKVQEFFDYLDELPWKTTGLDWDEIPNLFVPFGERDPQPQWVGNFSNTPLGGHKYIMIAYAPGRDGIIGDRDEVLADLDLLYSGSPGPRYFCGADVTQGRTILTVQDFAEFSDEGVTVHAPTE
ncbi:hypothetical protein [Streptomyces sp. NPDC048106]|uniref:hypothetical protein n=1 Tax=Streptomyces sp. NPDC048106 TaxID=3155750 RepID=UPI003456B58E